MLQLKQLGIGEFMPQIQLEKQEWIFANHVNIFQKKKLNVKNVDALLFKKHHFLPVDVQLKNGVSGKTLMNNIEIYDNLLKDHEHSHLINFVRQSRYSMYQESGNIDPLRIRTSRFSCMLNKDDLNRMMLEPILQRIVKKLGQDLFLGKYYIGHYDKVTCSSDHIDHIHENMVTILIYPNTFWSELWGGDLKFYKKGSLINEIVDFVPGRIIVFDSRIKHKVMPLSSLSEDCRFSITLKGCFYGGLKSWTDHFGEENLIHISST